MSALTSSDDRYLKLNYLLLFHIASIFLLCMHLTQPTPTNCICSLQLDEFYHNMLCRLNEVHTQINS